MRFSSSRLALSLLLGALGAAAQDSSSSSTLSTVTSEATGITASSTASYSTATTVSTTATASAVTSTATTSSNSVATGTASAPTSYSLDPSFSITTATTTRSYSWTIAAQTGAPDGYDKTLYTINGQMPGPLVEANEGDTLEITVTNTLSEGTSIHWHGMYQNGTAYEDGECGLGCMCAERES